MSHQKSLMGIDLGTQSIKVIIYDPDAKEILARASCPLELISNQDGTAEQLASWWIEGLKNSLAQIDEKIKNTVSAIGVSGQQHGFVALDKDGNVLTPVKLWCDTTSQNECHEITAAMGGKDQCIIKAGNPIAVGYTASKILWLKNNDRNCYDKLVTILLPHDYINFYLTGNLVMEYGDASGTGLLDVRNRIWSDDIISVLDKDRDLKKCLPRLINSDDISGHLSHKIAAILGLKASIIVSAGGGDNMMAAIGTGNVKNGVLTASLGTSGTLFAHHDQPIIDPAGQLAAFCSSTNGWLPLLCTMNCTVATEQMRELLHINLNDMERLAANISPGADGVITIPYYNGERSPDLPNAKASIMGLDSHNCTKAHLLRSAMEAAIFNLKGGLEAFNRCGMSFDDVILTGGGSQSALWRQICADILNLPVHILNEQENAAFGAALQALWAYNKKNDTPSTIKEITTEHLTQDKDKSCAPNPENVKKYEDIYKEYQSFVKLIATRYK